MYANILVPIELGDREAWAKSLQEALKLVRTHGAELHLCSVVPDLGLPVVSDFLPPDYAEKARQKAHDDLAAIARSEVPKGIDVKIAIGEGKVHKEILRIADEIGADLIVLGGRQHGVQDYLLGTHATHVVQSFKRSVLVVR